MITNMYKKKWSSCIIITNMYKKKLSSCIMITNMYKKKFYSYYRLLTCARRNGLVVFDY